MNLLKMILGSYCKSASKSLFIKTKSDSKPTPEREVLKDTRMAVFSETAAEDALNDEVLKMASGNDPIRVNPKYHLVWRMESDLLDPLFTWILDGAIHWYASGLVDIPAVMQKATKAYLNENDKIGEFLADETKPVEGQDIPSKGLYTKYCEWCRGRNAQPKGLKTFSQDMEKRFKKECRRMCQVFVGLRLKVADLEVLEI
jgi:phage/plasmid-associated DNA primase